MADPKETRMIACPECGGDRGWEVLTHYDPRDGDPKGYWQHCEVCEATGEIEIEVEPVTMEDIS